jgi:hypothetical protein
MSMGISLQFVILHTFNGVFMLNWLKRKFGSQNPSSIHSQVEASEKDYGVLLYEQLVSHIQVERNNFDWRNSNKKTGLPSNPAITRRIEEVLDNLDEYFENVEVERNAKGKGTVIRLTKYQYQGLPKEYIRKDEDWFGAKTLSRFVAGKGAHADTSEVFDYVSLFLGYPSFDGFKNPEKLTSKAKVEDSQVGESPKSDSEKPEIEIGGDKPIPKLYKSLAVALLLLVCLIAGGLVINKMVGKGECTTEKGLLSAMVMDFLPKENDAFSRRLIKELRARVTEATPLRVLSGDKYVDTKSPAYPQEVESSCQLHCLGKGVVIYGDLESGFGFVDCQIDVINLRRGDSVITENHYYLKDPGTYKFNLPQRATLVADFVWALLYYHLGKDQMTVSMLDRLLENDSGKVDGTFLSSVYLLLGNAHMHLGNYILAMNAYENISQIDNNIGIASQNKVICQELLRSEFMAMLEENSDSAYNAQKHRIDSSSSSKIVDSASFAGFSGNNAADLASLSGRTDTVENLNGKQDPKLSPIPNRGLRKPSVSGFSEPSVAGFTKPQVLTLDPISILKTDSIPTLNLNGTNAAVRQPSRFHFVSELQTEVKPAFVSPTGVVVVSSSALSADEIKIDVRTVSPNLKKILSKLELDPFGLLGKAEELKFAELDGGMVWKEHVCLGCAVPKGGWELFQFRVEYDFAPFCLAGLKLTGFDKDNNKLFTEYVLRHSLIDTFGKDVILASVKKIYTDKEGADK